MPSSVRMAIGSAIELALKTQADSNWFPECVLVEREVR